MSANTPPPPGWYADPQLPGTVRFWDGGQWTAETQPAAPPQSTHQQGSHLNAGQVTNSPPPRVESEQHAPAKIGFFGARKQAEKLLARNSELERIVAEIGAMDIVERRRHLADLDAQIATRSDDANAEIAHRRAELDAEIEKRRSELDAHVHKLTAEIQTADTELSRVKFELITVRGQAAIQDAGLYDYHHPAESSVQLKAVLDATKAEIKEMIRKKTAATESDRFTFNNSKVEGRRFVNDLHAMMLAAYNAEAENCVKSVKAGNLDAAVSRLSKARERIAKRGDWIDVAITNRFHLLRVKEMELAADYWKMKEEEKEADRARREELREQRKVEQEIARQREKLEKERQHYAGLIATLEAQGDTEALEKARAQLAEVDKGIEDVDYRAANVRAGWVYVISNVGAFGDGVVKIGMTRRLEPMDRVNELGDASVPFRFDVHTLFFSEDAVSVEAALHRHFAEQRVNKVNQRREFFHATPHQVLQALEAQVGVVTEFIEDPVAEEFRISRGELSTTF